jgi:hypothetical protein
MNHNSLLRALGKIPRASGENLGNFKFCHQALNMDIRRSLIGVHEARHMRWRHIKEALSAAFIFSAITCLIVAARTASGSDPEGLPEIYKKDAFASEAIFKQHLMDGAKGSLEAIIKKHPKDLSTHANCELAKTWLESVDNLRPNIPIILGAYEIETAKMEHMLLFNAFNMNRETDKLIVAFDDPEGHLCEVCYSLGIAVKDESYTVMRGYLMTRVSLKSVMERGKISAKEPNVTIQIDFSKDPICVPEAQILSVSVGDRSGKRSNFVLLQKWSNEASEK